MAWLPNLIRFSIGKKCIMATTGAFLGFFLLAHAAGNATSFWGKEALNAYVGHLHSLEVLLKIFQVLLGSFFLAHVLTATLLFVENLKARPRSYAVSHLPPASWPSRIMPYTGMLILVFVLFHLRDFHFAATGLSTAELFRQVLGKPAHALFYLFSLTALTLHTVHGFWSMLQTSGLNHPKYNSLLHKGSLVSALLVGLIFMLIPLLTLFKRQFLQ